MSAIEIILPRLDLVRAFGKDRWSARCPAHEDKGPSLSLRELEDGRVLLHCFAGCPAADVIGAIGLKLSDLFQPPPITKEGKKTRPNHYHAMGMALRTIQPEVLLVAIAAGNMAQGIALGDADRERLIEASRKIRSAMEVCK